ALTRIPGREEPRQGPLPQPGEPRLSREHLVDGAAITAECDGLDPVAVGLEHTQRGFRGRLNQLARLLLPPPPEAVRRRAALLVPALDEARPHLGRRHP